MAGGREWRRSGGSFPGRGIGGEGGRGGAVFMPVGGMYVGEDRPKVPSEETWERLKAKGEGADRR